MFENLRNDVRLTKQWIEQNPKKAVAATAVTVGALAYSAGNIKGVVTASAAARKEIEAIIEMAKIQGVGEWINYAYSQDLTPMLLDQKQLQLYVGVMVNAGEFTQEAAKQIFDDVAKYAEIAKNGIS